MRLAPRTVDSSWFATTTIVVAELESVEHRRIRARHVEHDAQGSARAAQSIRLRTGADVHRSHHAAVRTKPADRGRTSSADQRSQERIVQPLDVLERIGDRKPRFGADKQRGVAACHVQVDQQRRRRRGFWRWRSRRSRPASSCPRRPCRRRKRHDLARVAQRLLRHHAVDRSGELAAADTGSVTNSVTPDAHRFEHQ